MFSVILYWSDWLWLLRHSFNLDLSVTFDTVDHSTLIYCFDPDVSIKIQCWSGFGSYLCGKNLDVSPGTLHYNFCSSVIYSPPRIYPWLFLLGSFSLLLLLVHLSSFVNSLKYEIPFHLYMDDSQIYMPLQQKCTSSPNPLFQCLKDNRTLGGFKLSQSILHCYQAWTLSLSTHHSVSTELKSHCGSEEIFLTSLFFSPKFLKSFTFDDVQIYLNCIYKTEYQKY